MSTIETAPAVSQSSSLPRIDYSEPLASAPPKAPRLESLDIFRGLTIAAMILVNNQPDPKYWPLEHVEWHGWTPTDLIFPFFLFIMGVATPFSLGKRASSNTPRSSLLAHIWARALSLFVLGELLTGLPYTSLSSVPAGHAWITSMRAIVAGFCLVGALVLLIPWRSPRISLALPIALCVIFYLTALVCHQIISRASGLPNDFSFGNGLLNPTHLRIPGVLQRIGICYGVAATIGLFFGWRMVLIWAIALMSIYSALMLKVPFKPSATVEIPFAPRDTSVKAVGELTKENNLSRRLDEWLLIRDGRWNHAYGNYPDNEGALSTLPSIAEVLLGILAGVWLRTFRPAAERGMGLLVFGLFAFLAGLALDRWLMPINKNIWTPSFTVFTAGVALLCLGTIFFFVDVLGRRRWAFPFKVYGMNAIAAFVISGLVFKLLSFLRTGVPNPESKSHEVYRVWGYSIHFYETNFPRVGEALHLGWLSARENASLAFALSYVLAILILMWVLYVCRIFVKV